MAKICCLCDDPAKFVLKSTSDYYCKECAIDFFGDISLLLPLEEQAKQLKKFIDEKVTIDEEGQYIIVNSKSKTKSKRASKATKVTKKAKSTIDSDSQETAATPESNIQESSESSLESLKKAVLSEE